MSEQIWHECGLCGGRFQYGPHRYEGHFIARYKLVACDRCWHGNADGWGPVAEPKVLAHLKRNWDCRSGAQRKGAAAARMMSGMPLQRMRSAKASRFLAIKLLC